MAGGSGGDEGAGHRRLLTKRGGLLGRTVRRWCELEQQDLVYYATKDARVPRGRIPLRECELGGYEGEAEDAAYRSTSSASSTVLDLLLPSDKKGRPCQIHAANADDLAEVVAHIRSFRQPPPEPHPLPPAEIPLDQAPPMPFQQPQEPAAREPPFQELSPGRQRHRLGQRALDAIPWDGGQQPCGRATSSAAVPDSLPEAPWVPAPVPVPPPRRSAAATAARTRQSPSAMRLTAAPAPNCAAHLATNTPGPGPSLRAPAKTGLTEVLRPTVRTEEAGGASPILSEPPDHPLVQPPGENDAVDDHKGPDLSHGAQRLRSGGRGDGHQLDLLIERLGDLSEQDDAPEPETDSPEGDEWREPTVAKEGSSALAVAAAAEEPKRQEVVGGASTGCVGAGGGSAAVSTADGSSRAEAPSLSSSSQSTTPAPRRLGTAAQDSNASPEGLSPSEAYARAMNLMWNYDLDSARRLLEPWRRTHAWHAGAYAECSALRVALTGRRCEALATLELVQAAEALRDGQPGGAGLGADGSLSRDVFSAELLLFRGGLQVILGARLRALFNLRQAWCAYRRLEHHVGASTAAVTAAVPTSLEDLRGRVAFGLGLIYLAASLLPGGLCSLARLAGFVVNRTQGKAYLSECAEGHVGPRASLAAIVLAMYHLDLEPDVPRAGALLVASLGRQPENVLLHWAGSLLAWRNTCVTEAMEMTGKALWCCGEELGNQAVYLRYELGMCRLLSTDWQSAHMHLRFVYDTIHMNDIFFPYRTVVTAQLAGAAFSLGRVQEGEELCRSCASTAAAQDWGGGSSNRFDADFAKVLQLFLKQRALGGRQLLAFEVMYFLRQFPKVPPPLLLRLQDQLQRLAEPHARRWQDVEADVHVGKAATALSAEDQMALVELVSAQALEITILFFLGDLDQAMTIVPQVVERSGSLPAWCTYICAHGLYWCGRILALADRPDEAVQTLLRAKSYKKYPFHIGVKISKALQDIT